MLYLQIKDAFVRELDKHFDSKLEMGKRVRVVSDLQMFDAKEDKFVWGQKKNQIPEHFMVYVDEYHVCTFHADEPLKAVLVSFWKGFTQAYKDKKIRLTPPRMRVDDEKPKSTKQLQMEKLDAIKPTTKAERMAKEIVTNIVKGKKQ